MTKCSSKILLCLVSFFLHWSFFHKNNYKLSFFSVIKAAVAQSDLSNLDGLLETILKQLRPVVLRACEAGLAASNLNLDANELADEIMIQITPFVSSSLEQEAQKATALSEDQVVQIIITDLKPTGNYYL